MNPTRTPKKSVICYTELDRGTNARKRRTYTVRPMRIASWVSKPTYTHRKYEILIAFALQQQLGEGTSVLRLYTEYIACLLLNMQAQNLLQCTLWLYVSQTTVHRAGYDSCQECDSTHVQDLVANDELLLTNAESSLTMHSLGADYSKSLMFSVSVLKYKGLSLLRTAVQQSTGSLPHRTRHAYHPARIILRPLDHMQC